VYGVFPKIIVRYVSLNILSSALPFLSTGLPADTRVLLSVLHDVTNSATGGLQTIVLGGRALRSEAILIYISLLVTQLTSTLPRVFVEWC
jgi:hypothetical protein